MEESRGTHGRTDFRFHSFCTPALLSHRESLKSEVKVLRQGSIPPVLKCFLSRTWTPPSVSRPETPVTGVGSKRHSVSWGGAGMGTRGNHEEGLGGVSSRQVNPWVLLLRDLSVQGGTPYCSYLASGSNTLPATCLGPQLAMHSYPRIPAPGLPSCFSRCCSGRYHAPFRMLFF